MNTHGQRGLAKRLYPKVLEASLVIALLLVTLVFLVSKQDQHRVVIVEHAIAEIEITDVPYIPPRKKPQPPERPSLPIEDPDIPLEDPIDWVSPKDWGELPELAAYQPKDDPREYEFFAVEHVPEIVGGTQALYTYMQRNNLYPEMARRLGNDGVVQVEFLVTVNGKATDFSVLDERPKGLGFAEVAIEAISAMTFTPGIQRDIAVPVRMKQVIQFRLR
jgi:periplasmic protein TonB